MKKFYKYFSVRSENLSSNKDYLKYKDRLDHELKL